MRHVWLAVALGAMLGWISPLAIQAEDTKADKPGDQQKQETDKGKGHSKKHHGRSDRDAHGQRKHHKNKHGHAGRGHKRGHEHARASHARGKQRGSQANHARHGYAGRSYRGQQPFHRGPNRADFARGHAWSHPRGMWTGPAHGHQRYATQGGNPAGYHGPRGFGPQQHMQARGFAGHGPHPGQMHSAHRGPAPWMHAHAGRAHAGFAHYQGQRGHDWRQSHGYRGPGKDSYRDHGRDRERKDRDDDDDRGQRPDSKRESSRHRNWN